MQFVGSLREARARGEDILIGTINLAGVKAGFGGVDIPDQMPIQCIVEDITFKETQNVEMVEIIDENGNKQTTRARSWLWTLKVTEPDYAGAKRTITGRVPDLSEKGQKAFRTLRTAGESAGYDPATIDQGALAYVGGLFLDKTIYVVNRHKAGVNPDGTQFRDYDDAEFLTPQQYVERKEAIAKNGLPPQPFAALPRKGASAPQPAQPSSAPQQPASTVRGPAQLVTAGSLRTPQPANGGAKPLSAADLKASLGT